MNCNREIGEIVMFAGSENKVPMFYAFCDGRSLRQDLYANLYSIIGDVYTPLNARNTTHFNIPDMRGMFPRMSTLGETGGSDAVELQPNQLPNHTHTLMGTNVQGNSIEPSGNSIANAHAFDSDYSSVTPTEAMHPASISATGNGDAHENLPPYLGVNFIIYTGI